MPTLALANKQAQRQNLGAVDGDPRALSIKAQLLMSGGIGELQASSMFEIIAMVKHVRMLGVTTPQFIAHVLYADLRAGT